MVIEKPAITEPVRRGTVIRAGDVVDFGTEAYCIVDDENNTVEALSGYNNFSVSGYHSSFSQYECQFSFTDQTVYITSEDLGTVGGIYVSDGNGTNNNPFVFKVLPDSETEWHTLELAFNDGTTGSLNLSDTKLQRLTLAEPPTLRPGYDFTGWNTEPDGSGTALAAGETVMVLDHLVLYAQWTPIMDVTD